MVGGWVRRYREAVTVQPSRQEGGICWVASTAVNKSKHNNCANDLFKSISLLAVAG